jgi:membrane fusion protein (multidrug efflux system)
MKQADLTMLTKHLQSRPSIALADLQPPVFSKLPALHDSNSVGGGRRMLSAAALIILSAALAGCGDDSASETQDQDDAPVRVSIAQPVRSTVPLERVYPARIQAAEEVEVQARVQGILLQRHYTEGRAVKAGDLLFSIDPAPFEARVQQANAALQRAEAELRQAGREWARVSEMFKDKAVSARDRDEAQSIRELAQADVATQRALLRDARIQLGYTEVKAPINGIVGMREVSDGNLVQAGDRLTIIRQLDPVHILFSMPEPDALAHRLQLRDDSNTASSVRLQLADGSTYEQPGNIDFTATALDAQTGNVQVRAVVANSQAVLLPGQFTRVSLNGLEFANVMVLPREAVGQGPQGPIVYVLDNENHAQPQPVTLGPSVDQGQVITDGLNGDEHVVVSGLAKIKAGQLVAPAEAQSATVAEAGQ